MLERVLEAVRRVRPARLYFSCDGPRPEKGAHEQAAVAQAQKVVTDGVDWDCELKTLLRTENLGCRRAVSEGLSWFFEQEESGIVLEDDCLPSPDFFRMCDACLKRYREDPRIATILGTRPLCFPTAKPLSTSLTRVFRSWGWASWRRTWNLYRDDIFEQPEPSGLYRSERERRYWTVVSEAIRQHHVDSWAFRFGRSCLLADTLHLMAPVNLVRNIGFQENSTHTKVRPKDAPKRWGQLPEGYDFSSIESDCLDDDRYFRLDARVPLTRKVIYRLKTPVRMARRRRDRTD